MPGREQKNRKNAAGIGFTIIAANMPKEDNFGFVAPRQLNQLCSSAGMQSHARPDGDLTFGHACFIGASSSLAI